ncbi:MAG TPA: hypothetical protein VFO40_15695, partial [Chthoniobacterales bacterium]|nr:hypothetical protein [Chthoniobacterales bacterium]
MAEAADSSQSKPAPSLPEPDLDALLGQLPQFKEAFGPPTAESGDTQTVEQSAPPDTDEGTQVVPDESGLPEAEPLEEGESAEEHAALEAEPEGLPESVQKRIDVLTAKRKTAEERVAALEAENTQLRAQAQAPPLVAPSPDSPLADIETHDVLARRLALVQQTKTWAIQNLDGGEVALGEGKTKFLDGAEVKNLLARAEEMLSIHFP